MKGIRGREGSPECARGVWCAGVRASAGVGARARGRGGAGVGARGMGLPLRLRPSRHKAQRAGVHIVASKVLLIF